MQSQQGGVCNASQMTGLGKCKIIADRRLWVKNRASRKDKVDTNF